MLEARLNRFQTQRESVVVVGCSAARATIALSSKLHTQYHHLTITNLPQSSSAASPSNSLHPLSRYEVNDPPSPSLFCTSNCESPLSPTPTNNSSIHYYYPVPSAIHRSTFPNRINQNQSQDDPTIDSLYRSCSMQLRICMDPQRHLPPKQGLHPRSDRVRSSLYA